MPGRTVAKPREHLLMLPDHHHVCNDLLVFHRKSVSPVSPAVSSLRQSLPIVFLCISRHPKSLRNNVSSITRSQNLHRRIQSCTFLPIHKQWQNSTVPSATSPPSPQLIQTIQVRPVRSRSNKSAPTSSQPTTTTSHPKTRAGIASSKPADGKPRTKRWI